MLTNFGLLTTEQKTIWSKDLWKNARNHSFVNQFMGSGTDSLIQHITELKKSEKGARAVITLLADLTGDGIAGDRTLEGNEEAMLTYDQVIRVDQLRDAVRHEGRMADQKSVVEFRHNAKNRLAYWLGDRCDQMAFLTLAGIDLSNRPNGAVRVGSDLKFLEFNTDITAPSAKRITRWDATAGVLKDSVSGSHTSAAVTAADFPQWKTLVQLKAYAKDRYIRGVGGANGKETFHAFLTPQAMAKLKLDTNYMDNLRHSTAAGINAKLFSGDAVEVDGIVLHEFRHVPNTTGTSAKYGAGANIQGCQILFCGAQALGMADIGEAIWEEKGFDYENSPGISVGKIVGFKKPVFGNIYESNTAEDFAVVSCYVAQ